MAALLTRVGRVIALMRDPRVSKLPRLAVVAAIGYALWPADLLPGFVFPVVGYLDDLALLWLSLRWLVKSEPSPSPTERGG